MNFSKIYALGLRHLYLIMNSFPRVLDLIYWPTVQIFLWGFISKFFTLNSEYYSNTVGVILTAAILYDFLFRASISFNMMFLEEIWSRNFTNLFIAPIKIREIIAALTLTAIVRTLIGLVPAVLIAIPLFGVSVLKLGIPLIFLLISLYLFGITLGLLVTSGLLRYGPSFENIAWANMSKKLFSKFTISLTKIILPLLFKIFIKLKINRRVINYLSEKSYFSNNIHNFNLIIKIFSKDKKIISLDVEHKEVLYLTIFLHKK